MSGGSYTCDSCGGTFSYESGRKPYYCPACRRERRNSDLRWCEEWARQRRREKTLTPCCGAKDAPTYVYARIQRGGEAVVVEVRGQPSFRLADLLDRRFARKQGKD